MGRQNRVSALYSFLCCALLLCAIPAHATFPGANGRIAFGDTTLRSMVGNSTLLTRTAPIFNPWHLCHRCFPTGGPIRLRSLS